MSSDTTVNWSSIDIAGNVESNYKPDGLGSNYNKQRVDVHGLAPEHWWPPATSATTSLCEAGPSSETCMRARNRSPTVEVTDGHPPR
ncbi:hypothetical protein [Micromonospora maritima]|uniref:hypothetical protein n=1 Tax=Micromonospora maritima TaxID=986711 RepID=UPI00157C05F1|nr:hypothetical protein [Micromonospora maritima]